MNRIMKMKEVDLALVSHHVCAGATVYTSIKVKGKLEDPGAPAVLTVKVQGESHKFRLYTDAVFDEANNSVMDSQSYRVDTDIISFNGTPLRDGVLFLIKRDLLDGFSVSGSCTVSKFIEN